MSLLTNLVSYWKFDESSGNAADSHGSNTLTNTNSATFSAGKINNGADLELASAQYFTIADASQSGLDFSTALSFSLWYKPESVNAPLGVLLGKRAANNESYYFAHLTTPGLRLSVDSTGNGTSVDNLDISTTLNNGTWYHLVVTWDGATKTAKFYVNGTQTGGDQTGTNVASIFNGTAPFQNAIDGGQYSMDGMIDEVGVWSRVLTASEVTQLYNGGSGFAYPFVYTINLLENLSTSIIERLTRAWTAPRSRTDAVAVGEITTRTWNAPRSPIDIVTITESINSLKGRIIELLETMGIIDTVSRTVSWTRNFTDTVTIIERLNRVIEVIIIELVSITDTVSRSWSLSRSLLDSVPIIEYLRTPLNWLKRTKPTTTWTPRTKP